MNRETFELYKAKSLAHYEKAGIVLTQAEKEVGLGPTSIEDTTVPQMRSLRQDIFLTQAEKTE